MNIRLDDDTLDTIEEIETRMGAETRGEAAREIIDDGIERYRQRQRMPDGAPVVRQGILMALVASVVALSVGVGLGSGDVMRLAGAFGGVAVLLGVIMGAMTVHARRGLM